MTIKAKLNITKGLTAKQVIAKLRSKAEKPKDEESKDENPKDEEAKAENPKDENPKDENPKDDEAKDEESKDEGEKLEDGEEAKDEESKDAPMADMDTVLETLNTLAAKIDLVSEGLAIVLESAGLIESDEVPPKDEGEGEPVGDEAKNDEEKAIDNMTDEEVAAALEETIAELEKFEE